MKRKYANPDNLDSAFGLGLMEQPYQFAGRFSIGQRLDQRQLDQCLRQVPTRIGRGEVTYPGLMPTDALTENWLRPSGGQD